MPELVGSRPHSRGQLIRAVRPQTPLLRWYARFSIFRASARARARSAVLSARGSPSRWAAAFRRGGSICLVPGPWRRGGPDVVAERSPRGLAGLAGDGWARPADQYVRGLGQGQPVDQRLHPAGTVRADPDAGLGPAGLVRGSVATRGPVHRRRALPRADDRQLGALDRKATGSSSRHRRGSRAGARGGSRRPAAARLQGRG
ncbi:MAG: hypothetical protein QOH50_4512 [Kribbellaceae bacterium]|nr:hypothetical protein [Kribbellaceae bacterium]